MAGYQYVVSGDPALARNTVYKVLESQGYRITTTGEWTARAERGSQGASIAFGGFTGKAGRYVVLDIACQSDPQGNLVVSFLQGTSGWSGGLMGRKQAQSLYSDFYNAVSQAFQGAGVLISGIATK